MSTKTRVYKSFNGRPFQDWLTIEIEERPCDGHYVQGTTHWVETSKHVFICSRIHLFKRKELTFSFCGSFSDHDILRDNDVSTKLCEMFRFSSIYA